MNVNPSERAFRKTPYPVPQGTSSYPSINANLLSADRLSLSTLWFAITQRLGVGDNFLFVS